MDDMKLIELVRSHTVLYESSHRKFLDSKLKKAVWNEIGREIGESGTACKMRWNNIRDNFRKNLYKNAINRRQGKKLVRPYRYHDELTFLKKHLGTKNPTENIEDIEITDGNDELSSQPLSPTSDTGVLVSQQSPSPDTEFLICQPSPVSDSRQNIYVTSFLPAHRRIRNRHDSTTMILPQTGAPEVIDYLVRQNDEPVNAFLASIASTLKELHPCDWYEAKSELFALVQKYEEKILRQRFEITRTQGVSDRTNLNSMESSHSKTNNVRCCIKISEND